MPAYFYVTALSNFARGYDKYRRCYDKAGVPESTFADRFYVLRPHELQIGIDKATPLVAKTGLAGERLIVLEAHLNPFRLLPNLRTRKGEIWPASCLPVAAVHYLKADGTLAPVVVEEAMAASFAVLNPRLYSYATLTPRSLSVLPVAQACQAACRFCFSESSVSLEQRSRPIDLDRAAYWLTRAKDAGAQRFVITGGGEPGLLKHADLLALIALGARTLGRVTLITNGMHLSSLGLADATRRIEAYAAAGLSVLSISRHHHDAERNQTIMGVDTHTERVFAAWRSAQVRPERLRLISVLQDGGIDDAASLLAYVDWAASNGVDDLCFKELYVSTTLESAYHARPKNGWSQAHQVSLGLVTSTLEANGFACVDRLPWGAPIYSGAVQGRPMRIAAYTEPSLFWERTTGIARSWNVMADGSCLVSLEDPQSTLPSLEILSA